MNTHQLIDTARALVAGDKGLLAMDESNPTCNTSAMEKEMRATMYFPQLAKAAA